MRCEAARLFWCTFSDKLGRIMGPERKALQYLRRVIDPIHAFSAVSDDGKLIGVAGFKSNHGAFVGGGFTDLAVVYGLVGALWRAPLLALFDRRMEPDCLLMDGIFVRAEARGGGAGGALLEAIIGEAVGRGLSKIQLDVIDANPRAKALYEQKGFRAISVERSGPLQPLFGFRYATTMIRPIDDSAD